MKPKVGESKNTPNISLSILFMGGLLSILVACISSTESDKSEEARYEEYKSSVDTIHLHTIKEGEIIGFPSPYEDKDWVVTQIDAEVVGKKTLTLYVMDRNNETTGQISLYSKDNAQKNPDVHFEPQGFFYGDIALDQITMKDINSSSSEGESSGIKMVMHVIKATGKEVTYSLSTIK